jgi:hypothetical protein
MKAAEHMRYVQYCEFLICRNLMTKKTTASEREFGFWVWLKVVEQSEQLLRQSEACTDVHQC